MRNCKPSLLFISFRAIIQRKMKEKEKTGYETNFVCRTDDAVALRLPD